MEDRSPLVSIIAVNYNNAVWVLDTLNSIAAQTYPNLELIIVDDCSTDNSPQLIENWLKTCSLPVRFIRHEKNRGVCATCNTGFKLAQGRFISYTGTDDIFLPEKTAEQVRLLQTGDKETGMVYSDAFLMDDRGEPLYGWFIQKHRQDFASPPSGRIFEDLLKANFIPAMSVLIKKEVLEEVGYFDERLLFEDYDMWLRIASKYSVTYGDKPLVKYRVRQGSLSCRTKDKYMPVLMQMYIKFSEREDVLEKIVQLAAISYREKDDESLNILRNTGLKVPAIKKILFLHRFRFSHSLVRRIAYRLIK